MTPSSPTIITLALFLVAAPTAFAESVWIEAEDATSKSIQNNGWYSSVKKDELSGGGLIAHWGNEVGSASYDIEIPVAGTYVLWLRANPVGTKLNVNFDGGEWFKVDTKGKHHENINIASDEKIDLRFVSWVRAGVRKFTAGEHQIGVRRR